MRVAVVTNQAPFLRGGAEQLAEWLVEALEERGHPAELVRIPFAWDSPESVVDSMLAARLVRLPNVERVVALKFPAYYVSHADKVVWLLHQFRQAHELWGTPHQSLPDDADGLRVRDAVRVADRRLLAQARRIHTISNVVGDRLRRSTALGSEVLYHPLRDSGAFTCAAYEPFIFYPSRITAGKRQELAVEAMAHAPDGIRLIVAGSPETPEDLHRLTATVERCGVADRVDILPGWLEEDRKRDLLARCRAVLYCPIDEDSYGYVTLEAFHSRKPVITCTDSGGTHEVVHDGHTGWASSPTPESLGLAVAAVANDEREARRRGNAGRELLRKLKIDWDHVVDSLTA
jgi:glycosyltransferase involved in cell wall biosynthesis